jgi:hypothetical protein
VIVGVHDELEVHIQQKPLIAGATNFSGGENRKGSI